MSVSAIWPPSNFSAVMWDNNKMRAKKNFFAEAEDVRYLRPLFHIKTNVNSTCDVTNLDPIGPISVQDV